MVKIKKIIFFLYFLSSFTINGEAAQRKYNIGLLVVATGKYIHFVSPLIQSADKFFCKNHNVTYFIFTDSQIPKRENTVSIYQKKLGWPYDTMMRLSMYAQAKDYFKDMDYLFACDADMLFVDTVGDEILGERVGTLHPGFVGSKGTYETRSISTAYIPQNRGKHYFAGGFNGGSREEYIKMAQTITNNINRDLERGIVAVWHDESHINKYFADNEPTVILTPSYCYWEGKVTQWPQKLVALNKNHAFFRN